MRWSLLRIQLIPNYSYMLWPNCWFSMDFGDLSSTGTPPPPAHLLSIRSPGLISSLTMLSQTGSQLLFSFSFLFPSQAPAALLSLLSLYLPDSPRLVSHAAFVARLSQVHDREASYCQGKSPEDDVCHPLFLLLSSVGLCGVKEGRLSRESIVPQTFLSCSFKWFHQNFTVLWRRYYS